MDGRMRVSWVGVCLVCMPGVWMAAVRADVDVAPAGNALDSNSLDVEPVDKIPQEICSSANPMTCLKTALSRGLERLSRWPPNLEVFPGLIVKGDLTPLQNLPRDVTTSPGHPEDTLLRGLARYLSSLSLTVRVMDGSVMKRMQELGETLTQDSGENGMARKKRTGGALALAGLMSMGTMLALGMAAVAAMAGKAMMAALLSLMMSLMSSMKGGGDKGGSSYEVIHAHDHKHRSFDSEDDSSFNYPSFALPPSLSSPPSSPSDNRRSVLLPYIRRR